MKQLFVLLCLAGGLAYGVQYFAPYIKQSGGQFRSAAFADLPTDVVRGSKTFAQYCQHCHDVSEPKTIEQGGLLPYGLTEADLGQVLTTGPGNMPEFDGMFTDRDIQDLHAFLRHALKTKPAI